MRTAETYDRNLKSTINFLFYVALGAVGVIWIKKSYDAFLEGKTFFTERNAILTNADRPTLTICFEHEKSGLLYGSDYDIGIDYNDTIILTWEKNENSLVDEEGNDYNLHLTNMHVSDFKEWVYRYCHKVTPIQDNDVADDGIERKEYSYYIEFYVEEVPDYIYLYFTTESNSYGAVLESWYDGEVDPYVMRRGMVHEINIPHIKTFEFINSQCTNQPFYYCLAERLRENTTCLEYGSPCSNLTLPTGQPLGYLPYCNSTDSEECYANVLDDVKHGQECRDGNQKLCNVQEYTAVDSYVPYETNYPKGFIFTYKFTVPKSSRGYRQSNPFKVVSTEHFVMTGLGLLGTVGGTLGLMIGFSLSNTVEYIVDLGFRVWREAMKLKISKQEDRATGKVGELPDSQSGRFKSGHRTHSNIGTKKNVTSAANLII